MREHCCVFWPAFRGKVLLAPKSWSKYVFDHFQPSLLIEYIFQWFFVQKQKKTCLKNSVLVLCFSTSKWALCMPFVGPNNFFGIKTRKIHQISSKFSTFFRECQYIQSTKKFQFSPKKYFNQLLDAPSTQKLV